MNIHPASAMALYILLLLIVCILLLGFFVIVNLLVEIRDAITASCSDVKRLADEITDEFDEVGER